MFKKIIICSLLVGVLFFACEKSEEERIVGKWQVDKFLVDGDGDLLVTTNYSEILLEFEEDGDFEQRWKYDLNDSTNTDRYRGQWLISEEELDMDFDTNSPAHKWTEDFTGVREVYNILEFDDGHLEIEGVFGSQTVKIIADKEED